MKKPAVTYLLLFLLPFYAAQGISGRMEIPAFAGTAGFAASIHHATTESFCLSGECGHHEAAFCTGVLPEFRNSRKERETLRLTNGFRKNTGNLAMNTGFGPGETSRSAVNMCDPDQRTLRQFRCADYLVFGMLII